MNLSLGNKTRGDGPCINNNTYGMNLTDMRCHTGEPTIFAEVCLHRSLIFTCSSLHCLGNKAIAFTLRLVCVFS